MESLPPEILLNVFHYCFNYLWTLKCVHTQWFQLLQTINPTTNIDFQSFVRLGLLPENKPICTFKFFPNEESFVCLMLKGRVDILNQFDKNDLPIVLNNSFFYKMKAICLFLAPKVTQEWYFKTFPMLNTHTFHSLQYHFYLYLKRLAKTYSIKFNFDKFFLVQTMIDEDSVIKSKNIELLRKCLKSGKIVNIKDTNILIDSDLLVEFGGNDIMVTDETLDYFFQNEKYFSRVLRKFAIPKLMTFDNIDLYMKYVAPRSEYWLSPKCIPNGKLSLKFVELLFKQEIIPIHFHECPHLGSFQKIKDFIPLHLSYGLCCFIAMRYGLSSHYNNINMWTLIIEDEFLDNLKDERQLMDVIKWLNCLIGSHRINNTIYFEKIGSKFVFMELIRRWIINVWCRNNLWFFKCDSSCPFSQMEYWKFLMTLEEHCIFVPVDCNKMYSLVQTIDDYGFLTQLSPLTYPLKSHLILKRLISVFLHFDRFDLIAKLVNDVKTFQPGKSLKFHDTDLQYIKGSSVGKWALSFCENLGIKIINLP